MEFDLKFNRMASILWLSKAGMTLKRLVIVAALGASFEAQSTYEGDLKCDADITTAHETVCTLDDGR